MRISDWSSDVCSSDLLMTDWMGDDGFLRRLNVRVRDHNLLGDATWCKGTVTAKRVEEGQAIVSADIWCENQRGARTAVGSAEVVLTPKAYRSDHVGRKRR